MTKPLILSGSLAGKGLRRVLKSPAAKDAVVIEFDTLLNRSHLPHAATIEWLSLPDLLSREKAAEIDRQAREIIACYLREHQRCGDRPGDASLRRACYKARDGQIILSYLINHHLASEVMRRHSIGSIIAAPGAGFNPACWRRVAARGGVPFRELPVEITGPTLGRRIQKRLRPRAKRAPSTVPGRTTQGGTAVERHLLLCTSKRLGNLLQDYAPPPLFRLDHVSLADLGQPGVENLLREADFYEAWLRRFEAEIDHCFPGLPGGCTDVVSLLAANYVAEAYPSHAAQRKSALNHLRGSGAAMILSDTQTGSLERVWDLAAQELGIPIAAFTYDHLMDSATSLVPDYLISDSGRNTSVAIARGFAAARVFEVASFRKPAAPPEAYGGGGPPLALFPDNYFALLSAGANPAAGLGQYQRIVAAARLLPDVRFVIKAHPLRAKKTELLSYIGMDEAELQVRKRFIESLRPPRNFRFAPPEEHMPSLMASTSVLLNTLSHAGIEAFQLEIPVIFLEEPDSDGLVFPRVHEFLEPVIAPDTETLVARIRELLAEPARRRNLVLKQRRYLDEFYWKAQESLTSTIGQIVRQHFLSEP